MNVTVRANPDSNRYEAVDESGTVVDTVTVDAAGSLAWRELEAGEYGVRYLGAPATQEDAVVTDFDDPAPAQSFYDAQQLDEGFGYITTRDGTTLSARARRHWRRARSRVPRTEPASPHVTPLHGHGA